MERKRRVYQKRSPEQWSQLIADQRLSGESLRGFARSRGICESSLGYWSRRLGRGAGSDLAETQPALPGGESGGGAGLVELVAERQALDVELQANGDDLRLLVGSGVCLQLTQLPSPEYLALVARRYEAVSL